MNAAPAGGQSLTFDCPGLPYPDNDCADETEPVGQLIWRVIRGGPSAHPRLGSECGLRRAKADSSAHYRGDLCGSLSRAQTILLVCQARQALLADVISSDWDLAMPRKPMNPIGLQV